MRNLDAIIRVSNYVRLNRLKIFATLAEVARKLSSNI